MSVEFTGNYVMYRTAQVNLYDFVSSQGFLFSNEVLTRYYLSLKTKPFVILSGISGTGKTKIAQLFANYICQEDEKDEAGKRIAFVSVRPDWMDNKGLLGYYNILDHCCLIDFGTVKTAYKQELSFLVV